MTLQGKHTQARTLASKLYCSRSKFHEQLSLLDHSQKITIIEYTDASFIGMNISLMILIGEENFLKARINYNGYNYENSKIFLKNHNLG